MVLSHNFSVKAAQQSYPFNSIGNFDELSSPMILHRLFYIENQEFLQLWCMLGGNV